MSAAEPRPIDAATYAETERRLAELLDTQRDLLILQGEAILVLEATARGLGGPGVRVLNLVSGPYGEAIGDWLAVGGAAVRHLAVEFDSAIGADVVRETLEHAEFDVVSVVHAEAATGVVNPLEEIAAAAHAAGAVVLVDAVASVGAEPLPIDDWDLDLVMLGTQKAMSGPAGVCALVASERGWAQIASNEQAPRSSILSLLDWKDQWIDAGRVKVPGYAYDYEMRALIAALDELDGDVGLQRLVALHHRAGVASRAGARALGLDTWVANESDAASVVTLLRPPAGVAVTTLVEAARSHLQDGQQALITSAPGPLGEFALRVNHTGAGARSEAVIAALTALATGLSQLGLRPDLTAALAVAHTALTDA
jgi:aspartate aminotransferase-like enzyme